MTLFSTNCPVKGVVPWIFQKNLNAIFVFSVKN